MDLKRPPQARRPMVPLAAAATVVQSLPARPPARRSAAPVGSIVVALAVMAAAFVANSPLMGQFGVEHRWAWGILGFWGEVGGLLALLGMLLRQPPMAWVGAAAFFAAALLLSGVVWVGHPAALALIGAVAAWQMRRQAWADQRPPPQGWLQA